MYTNTKNRLYHYGQKVLEIVKTYINMVEEAKMCDKQFFIEWEDCLNLLSVKDHNEKSNNCSTDSTK